MTVVTIKRAGQRAIVRHVDPIREEQVRIGRELMQAEKMPTKGSTVCPHEDLSALVSKAPQPVQYFLRHVAASIDTLRKNTEGLPPGIERQLMAVRNLVNREAERLMKEQRLQTAARRREREELFS
jgi:hypothetical protein